MCMRSKRKKENKPLLTVEGGKVKSLAVALTPNTVAKWRGGPVGNAEGRFAGFTLIALGRSLCVEGGGKKKKKTKSSSICFTGYI